MFPPCETGRLQAGAVAFFGGGGIDKSKSDEVNFTSEIPAVVEMTNHVAFQCQGARPRSVML